MQHSVDMNVYIFLIMLCQRVEYSNWHKKNYAENMAYLRALEHILKTSQIWSLKSLCTKYILSKNTAATVILQSYNILGII